MKDYQVALSFAGEQRPLVEAVAEELARALGGKDQVFYDRYHEAELALPNLDVYLQTLYHDHSRLIVIFLGADYERKEWCGLEWRALRDLIKTKRADQIMFIRVDGGAVPGTFGIDGYIDAAGRSPTEIASLVLQRLGMASGAVAPAAPARRRRRWIGWGLLLALPALAGLLAYELPRRRVHAVLLVPGRGVFGYLPAVTDRASRPGDLVCSLRIHVGGHHLYSIPDLRRQPVFVGAPTAQLELAASRETGAQWVKRIAASTSLSEAEKNALSHLSWEMPRFEDTGRFQGGEEITLELVQGQSLEPLGSYRVNRDPGVQPILLVGKIRDEQP